ncbi:MAG: signal peptidase I [Alphaproteobacteria bacterium]|nr:signal peptidase I [Alphaproteobacteria bacterium]
MHNFKEKIWKNLKEWIVVIGTFVTISCFLYQPFKIPSGSMIPTLLVGDFLVVNKFCYGYSNDSFRIGNFTFPLPKIKERILGFKKPQRGDVAVFRNPLDNNNNYVKRIVGMPGEKIEIIQGVLHINDKPVELKSEGEFSIIDRGQYTVYQKYTEKFPDGGEHVMIKREEFGKGMLDNVGPYYVPEGHYFMMGDNRDNSKDSRVLEGVGYVPEDRIMGRAELIFFSSSCSLFEVLKWPFSIRYERIPTLIK